MKKVLMVFMVLVFIAGSAFAQVGPVGAYGVRDDDSYYIHFHWSNDRYVSPGGYGWEDLNDISITAARVMMGFNVYAKNGQPDYDTGAPVVDHSYYPVWYGGHGWDVADYDYYALTIDTHSGMWILCYIEYGKGILSGIITRISVPYSGKTKKMTFLDPGVIELELEEAGGNWKINWGPDTPWEYEEVKLDGKHFIAHLDFNLDQGYLVPKKIVHPKPPKKPKK